MKTGRIFNARTQRRKEKQKTREREREKGRTWEGEINRRGWVTQPLRYFTAPSYLAAPCGLANPQGFHRSGLDLSIQAERLWCRLGNPHPRGRFTFAVSPRGATCHTGIPENYLTQVWNIDRPYTGELCIASTFWRNCSISARSSFCPLPL